MFDLAAGTWLFGAGTWESVFATKSVEVTANAVTEITFEITDSGASGLVVRAVGVNGAPLSDVTVRTITTSNNWDGSELFSIRPKSDGNWVIQTRKELPANLSEWLIHVRSERHGEKTVPFPPGATGELKVEFTDPASLEVTVAGYAGSGQEGKLRVDARPLIGGKDQPNRYSYGRESQLGPDGRQTFKPLQPGRYRVELQYQQERWRTSSLDKLDVDVSPGTNSVSVSIPPIHSLTVVLSGEPADSNVNLQLIGVPAGEERWNQSRVGADGTAVFEGLVAGTYRISVFAPKARRSRSMKVTVPSSAAVTFKEEIETALMIKALDSEGYLASVGLQAGDVITGADGATFDGSRPAMQVLMGLITARKEIKLSATRAGKALDFTVDTEKFATATNHARALEPVSK
jgi:hypothetical protein